MLKDIFRFLNTHALHILIIWVILLSVLYSSLSIIRHNHFQSGAFDLGIFDQTVWQYSRLEFPYNTIKERFILGDHLTLTLPLLAPLFYIWNDVRSLLLFQAIFVSISTIPVFLFLKKRAFLPVEALLLSVMYSLFFGIQYGVYFDFHPIVLGAALVPWIFYFLEAKKNTVLWITIILALLTQENMGIALAGVGLCYVLSKEKRKYAITFIVGGLLFSVAAAKLVAAFSPVGYEYVPHISKNIIAVVQGFFDTPERRSVWLYSLSWFSFLPLLSPGAMLAIVLDLSQYFLLGRQFSWMQGPFLHHRAILAIFLLVGTAQVLEFVRRKKIPTLPIVILIFCVSLFLQFYFHFPLNKLSKSDYRMSATWMSDSEKLFTSIPPGASLAAQQSIVPHLTHRREIYLIWPRTHTVAHTHCAVVSCWWLDFSGKPTYMVVNLDQSQWVTQLLESPQNFSDAVNNMKRAGKITLSKRIGTAYLYKINYN